MVRNLALTAVAALLASACGSVASPAAKEAPKSAIIWRALGSWSGHGDTQTESFASDTGGLRVQWQTSHAAAGAGVFRLTAHSAISGRPLKTVVDQQGTGRGTSYVDEDPRVFYVVVESADLDWSFTVEEAFVGKVTDKPR